MAQQIETRYVCDVTGDPAAETVRFGVDHRTYEIDLSEVQAKLFRETFAPYVEAGRRVAAKRNVANTVRAARTDPEQLRAIRQWARANGHEVADRGRISEKILILFNAAH